MSAPILATSASPTGQIQHRDAVLLSLSEGHLPGADHGLGSRGYCDIPSDDLVAEPIEHRRVARLISAVLPTPHTFNWLAGSRDAHPDAHCQIRSATLAFDQPIDGVWASDHFGVLVELEIGGDT